jgi:hypothetical protein
MRTTINMPDHLLAQAKKAALESNTTLTEIITNAVRQALSKPKKTPRKEFTLITYGKGGVQPGVDLDDTSALLDLMDGVDDSHRR